MKARGLVVLGVLAVLPAWVSAQSRGSAPMPGITFSAPQAPPSAPATPGRGPGRPGPGRPGGGPPSFPVGAPPSHPLPTPFAGTVPNPFIRPQSPDDVFRATRRAYAPRYGRLSALRGSYYGYGGGYVDPNYYPYGGPVPDDAAPLRDGRLSLFVTPLSAQVNVDGYYVGTVADFQDRGLWLEPGPRRIEIRADGYETATFDVRITEDETVNYRRELTRQAARSPEPPRPPAPPKTFYVIPGCYAGDSRPTADNLPRGCSPKNLKTMPPVLSRLTPAASQAGPQSGTRPSPRSFFKF